MADLEIKRHFDAPPEKVFAFVTQPEHLIKWWGPEGITLGEHDLDFTRTGSWGSVMLGDSGSRHKVTGEVLSIEAGSSVAFTWAWHDDDDIRGHESQVRFTVESDGNGGTNFIMLHSGLADEESANDHNGGWTSSFNKLEQHAQHQVA